MLEASGELDLALEPLGAERGGEFGQHLQRHRSVVLEILGEIDGGHPTASERAVKHVAVAQPSSQCGD